MFGKLKLFMELQTHKDNPDKLIEIFHKNSNQLLNLKANYPEWKNYLKPDVIEVLRQRGLPVD